MADSDDDFTKQLEEAFTTDDKLSTEEAPKETTGDDKTSEEETKKPEEPEEATGKQPEDGDVEDGSKEKEAEQVTPPVEEKSTDESLQPLTKDDVRSVISDLRTEERVSSRELDMATDEVLEAYYPKGLSNVLVDDATGREIKTPQDVVDLSDGSMDMDQATKWLMNEQFKVDKNIAKIKEEARKVAETTVSFKRDGIAAVQKYEPLFKEYPHLQQKTFDLLMKQTKIDKDKNVVLSAPDVMDLYDTYLEPYQKAYEFKNNESATNPVPEETKPEPPKPSVDDRLDISGDGGASDEVDDPNDFAQQVKKEFKTGV